MKVNDETKIAKLEKSAAVWETRSSFSSQGGERGGWRTRESGGNEWGINSF